MNTIEHWMSWEGGVDLVAMTRAGLAMPNVIVHVARMVHTPVGSAPAGMIFWQPDPSAAPLAMGFVSTDMNVAKYFGPTIFAGTPFEGAPALLASISVELNSQGAIAKIESAGLRFETRLKGLGAAELIHRPAAAMSPFFQQGIESRAAEAELLVNGEKVSIIVPAFGMSGGPGALVSGCGLYAR